MNEQSDRLVSIETKLAYLEDTVERLHSLILEHTKSIDRLKAQNSAFRAKIGELEGSVQQMPAQRPPHY